MTQMYSFNHLFQIKRNIYKTSQHLLSEACIALGENLAAIVFMSQNPGKQQQLQQQQRDLALQSALGSNSLDQSIIAANTAGGGVARDAAQLTLRRNALNAFADAASFAARAQNYAYVVHSARHFWNLGVTYVQQAQERSTLFDNLREILTSWQLVYKFKPAESSEFETAPQEKVREI